jgi:hypothetical protein
VVVLAAAAAAENLELRGKLEVRVLLVKDLQVVVELMRDRQQLELVEVAVVREQQELRQLQMDFKLARVEMV